MVDWLRGHVFIAAWASPIIALVGLLLKKSNPTHPLNWSKIVIYVAYLTALAITVTPGVEMVVKGTMAGLVVVGFGMLNPSPYYQDHLEFPGATWK